MLFYKSDSSAGLLLKKTCKIKKTMKDSYVTETNHDQNVKLSPPYKPKQIHMQDYSNITSSNLQSSSFSTASLGNVS